MELSKIVTVNMKLSHNDLLNGKRAIQDHNEATL
jgi:hypothetical protein